MRTAYLLLGWLLMSGALVFAQQDQGVITGTVKDATGAVIPGAKVTARDVDRNISHTAQSNLSGVYTIGPIKIGTYEVTVERSGFKKAVRPDVELHPNDRIGVDFALELGNMIEVIEVTGATPMLQTEEASLAYVIQRRDIEQLPLNTRNYQTLALTSAGVVPEIGGRDLGPTMEGGHTKSGFVSHGQPALQNNYILDGIDNNNTIMGQQDRKSQAVIPSLDAVQEFKVQTSNYSAEFGRNAGAVVNITIKSGTNQLHGSAYDFLRNDIFDARPTFSYADRTGDGKADPEVLRQNQFGGTMGGPIIKNKTFFFGSFEGWRIRRARTARATVPSALERQGDFSQTPTLKELNDPLGGVFPDMKIPQSRMDPVALKIIDLYPQPNYSDPLTRTNFLSGPPNTIDRNQYDFRIDHTISTNDTIFGRYSYYTFDRLIGGPWSGIADSGDLHDNWGQHLTISETHIFSPNWVNEFRFGYKYLKPNRRSPSNTPLEDANAQVGIIGITEPENAPIKGMSRIQFSGGLGFGQLGGNFFNPNLKDMGTRQFVDNLNWIKGNHSFKFGADIRLEYSNIFGGLWTRGGWIFDGRYTGISLADAFLGWAYQTQQSRLDLAEYHFPGYMFYVQDDWKVTPTFTLNLGLRYELRPPWIEQNGRFNFVNFDPTSPDFGKITAADPNGSSVAERALQKYDKNNFGPRVGFAWRPADKWTIRAGAGIFYGGQMGLGASARPNGNFPFNATINSTGTNTRASGFIKDGIPPGFLGEPAVVNSVDDVPRNSALDIYTFDDPLPQTSQWNFAVQHQLARDMSLEVAYVGSATQRIDGVYNANDGGPGDPATERQRRLFPSLNNLNYRSPWGHASYHGMDVNLRKRFSQGYTFTAGYTWGHSISQLGEQFVGGDGTNTQSATCFSCERGNGTSDLRHRFIYTYIVELPFGRNRKFLNQGGIADAVLGGWQLSGMLSAQTGQYFDVTYPQKNRYLGTRQGGWRADVVGDWVPSNQGPDQWFLPEAFSQPCSPDSSVWTNCHQGGLGRNSLLEPGIFNWDLGLGKTFTMTERFRLQYRVETFNFTNTPSFGTPNRNMGGASPGVIRSTHSTERQVQMGLRLTW
jgi:hypothetical protein